MKIMDPEDPVIAGGTFSGNLMGCAAGLAAMGIMETPGLFDEWMARTNAFMDTLQSTLDEEDFPARVQSLGCSFYIYVGTRDPIRDYHDFDKLDRALAKTFFQKCIEKGAYFHTDFTVSAQHNEDTLATAADIIREAARETKAEAE